MNTVSLIGRLTRDIDLKKSNSGVSIGKFTLAVTRQFKKDESDFINCISFGKTGEILEKYVKKGQQLGITGRIQTGSYEDKDGKKRFTTDVVVDSFDLLGNKNKNDEEDEFLNEFGGDDDIPF